MIARAAVLALVLAVVGGLPLGAASVGGTDELVLKRDEDYTEIVALEDDDDGDTSTGYTSGVDSNDHTGSGHTAVSRDRDRSRGDKTRDWTRDGGDRTRDWTENRTRDRSRNDTR